MRRAYRTLASWTAAAASLTFSLLASGQSSDSAAPYGPPVGDERVQTHAVLEELEGRFGYDLSALRWDAEAWTGTDSNQLWLRSEGYEARGTTYDTDAELLYARPISPYFDLQAGTRVDLQSSSSRGWGALGVQGLAPGFIQLELTFYVSDASHEAARLVVSRDLLLTQRLILEPRAELNEYTRGDPRQGVDAGLSDLELGLRLRYEITRKFAPYAGVAYQRLESPASAPATSTEPVGKSPAWTAVIGLRGWL